METCFISKKTVIELAGEVDQLPAYLLSSANVDDLDRELIAAQASGYCYAKRLAASKWADFYGRRVRVHCAKNLGMKLTAEVDGMTMMTNLRTKVVTLIYPSGASFELPAMAQLESAKLVDGYRQVQISTEMNLHELSTALASEIQKSLLETGEFSLATLADRLGVTDCFLHPEVLATGKLVFNRKLKRYWDAESVSSDCNYLLLVPEIAVQALRGGAAISL